MANPGELNKIWASDPSAVIATPPDALEAAGWSAGQPPTAAHVNYLFNKSSTWWAYLKAALDDASSVFYFKAPSTFTSLRLHMVGGVNAWLEIDKTTGEFSLQHASGATNCLKVTADGLKGPTAVASASTGIRYGYPSGNKQASAHYYDPCLGGFTPVRPTGVNGIGPVYECAGLPEFWNAANASAVSTFDVVFRHRLLITSPTGQLSGYPVFTGLSATFSGTADDLTAKIWARNRTTGVDTAVSAIVKGSTPSDTFSVAATPATHDYFIELKAAGMTPSSVTSDGIRAIIVTMEWQSLVPTM